MMYLIENKFRNITWRNQLLPTIGEINSVVCSAPPTRRITTMN